MAASSVIDRIGRMFDKHEPDTIDEAMQLHMPSHVDVVMQPTPVADIPAVIQEAAKAPAVDTHAQQLVDLERFIDGEIRDRISAPTMTWRKLEACFKWRALQDYMAARGVASDSATFARIRDLLRSQQLTAVEYDAKSQAIRRINHETDVTCVALDQLAAAVVLVQ